MEKRIPASRRTSQKIEQLLKGGVKEGELRSEFLRLAVRKLLEEALEAEVSDGLGRDYYERGAEKATEGYRNGYRRGRLKTAEGEVEYAVPQVSDRQEPYRSEIREQLRGMTERLEQLAIEMYARGLSTRDVEDTFRDEQGRSLLSRTAVSEVTERLWEEYEGFATRDLSELRIVYLFLDGVAERLRPGSRREAVVFAWGIDEEGAKHLIHLAPGTKEDTESLRSFLQDLKRRGLKDPLFVVTDGAGGMIRSVEECLPRTLRGRCLVHKKRNLARKVPEDQWKAFKEHVDACYQAPSLEVARMLKEEVIRTYQKELPSAIRCFLDDFEACIAHLRFPVNHRKAIRTTNLLERLLEEERRRTKVMPHAFGERPLLKVMYAAVIRASDKWRGIRMTSFDRRQLQAIREELDKEFQDRVKPAVKPSKASRFSSKART
jgi:putative transposase